MNMPDFLEIAEAWKRAHKPTEEQARRADVRLATCNDCEFRTYKKLIHTYICGACNCPLNKKVFSPRGPEACPKGRWEE